MKNHFRFWLLLLCYNIILCAHWVWGKQHDKEKLALLKPSILDHQQFNGNNIACWMANDGMIVSHRATGGCGMEWPSGSGQTTDFSSGFWIIGKTLSGDVVSACSEYASEFSPGRLLANGTTDDPNDPRLRIYILNSDGTGDWQDWPFDLGAPALKAKDGGDSLDTSGNKIPRLYGNQTLWWVMNDADVAQHANIFATKPMGLEIHVLAFGFDKLGPLADMLFYEWTIHNKSQTVYDSTYIGLWDDPDLGDAGNDYAACDPARNMGFVYNPSYDAMYFVRPPAFGFQLLLGPNIGSVDIPQRLGMTAFSYFWSGVPDPRGDPEDAEQALNFLKGRLSDGTPHRDLDGNVTVFPLNGDPVTGEGDVLDKDYDSDYRFIVSSGPFALKPGDIQTIRAAKIVAQGENNLESITLLKKHADLAQNFHDQFFGLAELIKPLVLLNFKDAAPGVYISWNDLTQNYPQNGLELLGYTLYQVVGETLVELASFDAKDGITEIKEMIDGREVLLYSGEENGLATSARVTVDRSSGEPLKYGYTYTYFLRAFIHNTTATGSDRVISNDMEPVDYTYLPEGYQGAFYAEHTEQHGDGEVLVIITDPKRMNNHDYKIFFEGSIGDLRMKLVDMTTNHIVYHDTLGTIEFDSLGFRLEVRNLLGIKEWSYEGIRWVTGYNWGGAAFFGGLDLGHSFFGSTVPYEELVPIRIDFQDIQSLTADGYWTKGAVYRRDLGYGFAGIGDLPMAAFDVSDSLNPRKLNICFVEDERIAPATRVWNMGWNGAEYPDDMGAREYLFFMNSDYSEGAGYNAVNNGTSADILYFLWPAQRGTHPYLEAEFTIDIIPSLGLSDKDVFKFSAGLLNIKTPEITHPESCALVRSYPNPFNSQTTIQYELKQSSHVSIEIYNLWGQRIERLVDEQMEIGTHEITWNAQSAATGVYFIRFVIGGVKSQVIKALLIK
ncbi:T9SS C-terminal target domain-containing protein [candidate division KSB1 bacterium]|nr:T9SS type A sorting domain-containing protein [candidate division KSB1 bacterium]RQW06002.1 MAG: T9SS C-terminal target domain-containing protein [candidate division KSB1 bacterium]